MCCLNLYTDLITLVSLALGQLRLGDLGVVTEGHGSRLYDLGRLRGFRGAGSQGNQNKLSEMDCSRFLFPR